MRNRWNINAWTVLGLVFAGMAIYLLFNPTRTGVVPNYRNASSHWWASEVLYEGGTHGFLYFPQFAIFFTPITLIRPSVLGEIVWRALGFGLFGLGLWKLSRLCTSIGAQETPRPRDAFLLLTIVAVPASLASLQNGQTNLPLSAALVLAALAVRDQRWWIASWLLILCLFLKPIALAPWLLALAVFPVIRVPLLLGVPLVLAVGFIHPNLSYAWSQWGEFLGKLLRSYTPVDLRVSDLFGMLEKANIPNVFPVNTIIRSLASAAALAWVWFRFGRGGYPCRLLGPLGGNCLDSDHF
jgi:hypothetical protein